MRTDYAKDAFWAIRDNSVPEYIGEATPEEAEEYLSLAQSTSGLAASLGRFDRVQNAYENVSQLIHGRDLLTCGELTERGEGAVMGFLYTFRECLDHWETAAKRWRNPASDSVIRSECPDEYHREFQWLTHDAYDHSFGYRCAYHLRNLRHADVLVHGGSVYLGQDRHLYSERDRLLKAAQNHLKASLMNEIRRMDPQIELWPIIEEAYNTLWLAHIKLAFFQIPPNPQSAARRLCGKRAPAVAILSSCLPIWSGRAPMILRRYMSIK